MATEKQIAAARENGAKSKGPATAEGKARSSRNSRKHNLYSKPSVEEMRDVEGLVAEFTAQWQPANPTERALVRQIAMAEFRLRRIPHMEYASTELEEACHHAGLVEEVPDTDDRLSLSRAYEKHAKYVDFLGRHEARLNRQFRQSLDQLRSLQKERRAAASQASPQIEAPKNLENEPQPTTGFFSINDMLDGGLVPGLAPNSPWNRVRPTGRLPKTRHRGEPDVAA